jgi:Cyclic GMP-AMP synthase DncV-like, nucleotidyltransferase domain
MANCHNLFQHYNQSIRLSDENREKLMKARNSLRERMLAGFSRIPLELRNGHELDFQSQGSFVMDTIIAPVNDDYDLDDGVYFQGILDENKRPRPQFFHDLVIKAINTHGDIEKITDKITCVRVQYKDSFHIDLPIYYADNYECPDLAHTKKGWILSNPVEFIAWFENYAKSGFEKVFLYESVRYADKFQKWTDDIRKQDSQLRRIIRYMKAWADLKKSEMPCGLIMTILGTENYVENARDDIAFQNTLVNIRQKLKTNGVKCLRPTSPVGEDLFASTSATAKQYFMNALDSLINAGDKALETEDQKEACQEWQKHLGSRYPCHLAISTRVKIQDDYGSLKKIAVLSTPWNKLT